MIRVVQMQSSLTQTASNAYHHQYQTPIVTPPSSVSPFVDIPRPLSHSTRRDCNNTVLCTLVHVFHRPSSFTPVAFSGFSLLQVPNQGSDRLFLFRSWVLQGPFLLVFAFAPGRDGV